MLLAIDALDRLVELLEADGGRMRATEAAEQLFALSRAPERLARQLLAPLVESDARLVWRGGSVALSRAPDPSLTEARFVVVDLETTGLGRQSRISEIGAVRIEALQAGKTFQTLVAAEARLARPASTSSAPAGSAVRPAPDAGLAVRRFSSFAADAALVAHNARFDVGFLNRELARLSGQSLAAPVIDTVVLARKLLAGRVERTSLASLAFFFGVSVQPCHRALPDAQATAEVFLHLVEIARGRGAATLADLEELSASRPRRIQAKRRLIRDAPSAPGVYLFLDDGGSVLYVGKARNLRARLRSYFQAPRQRAAVEAALDKVERIEWRITGSELAAALEEIRLIRRLRPVANARTLRPEHYVYLHRRNKRVVLSPAPSSYGPIRRTPEAHSAARALRGCSAGEFEGLLDGQPLPRLRQRLAALNLASDDPELGRLQHELAALERTIGQLDELARLRRLATCVLAPAVDPGTLDAFVVADGRVAVRSLRGDRPLARELAALIDGLVPGLGEPPESIDADDVDELTVVASFIADPPEELRLIELRPGGRTQPAGAPSSPQGAARRRGGEGGI